MIDSLIDLFIYFILYKLSSIQMNILNDIATHLELKFNSIEFRSNWIECISNSKKEASSPWIEFKYIDWNFKLNWISVPIQLNLIQRLD